MKKTICGLLALTLLTTLSGCGSWENKFAIRNTLPNQDQTAMIGEIENTTGDTFTDVVITVEFSDESGKETWQNISETAISVLEPNEAELFNVYSSTKEEPKKEFALFKIKSVTFSK